MDSGQAPLVWAILGGVEMRLELDAEERLLAVLVARARAREANVPDNDGNLLRARAEAVRAGLVPIQSARPRRDWDEMLLRLRQQNRQSAGALITLS